MTGMYKNEESYAILSLSVIKSINTLSTLFQTNGLSRFQCTLYSSKRISLAMLIVTRNGKWTR